MSYKKLLTLIAFIGLLVLSIVVALSLFRGVELKSTLYGFFLMAMYVLLIAGYLSRFAMVVFGVFAIYKVLQERAKAGNIQS